MEFRELPSLTAFHLGNRTIKFPSLDHVSVTECPKVKIFYSGVFSTPKLASIQTQYTFKEEGNGDLDLNATIKEYWEWEAKLETCDQKFAEKVRCRILLLNTLSVPICLSYLKSQTF